MIEIDNLENFSIEDFVKKFFLGDDDAWEKVSQMLRTQIVGWLMGKPYNLSFQDAEDFVAESFTNFYFGVKNGQKKARVAAQNDGKADLNKLYLQFCSEETRFNLSQGSFKAWMWTVIKRKVIDFFRSAGSKMEPLETRISDDRDEENAEINYVKDGVFFRRAGADLRTDYSKPPFLTGAQVEKAIKDDEEKVGIIHYILSKSLTGDEFIYFEVWWEKWDKNEKLTAKAVIAEIYAQTGQQINDAQVTNLKHSFWAKSYLALIEVNYEIDRVIDSFSDFARSESAQEQLVLDMKENIWQSFKENRETSIELMRQLTEYRWREMFEAAETGYNRIETRVKILQIAYGYFKNKDHPPRFVRLIRIYGADRFGSEIRRTFGFK